MRTLTEALLGTGATTSHCDRHERETRRSPTKACRPPNSSIPTVSARRRCRPRSGPPRLSYGDDLFGSTGRNGVRIAAVDIGKEDVDVATDCFDCEATDRDSKGSAV